MRIDRLTESLTLLQRKFSTPNFLSHIVFAGLENPCQLRIFVLVATSPVVLLITRSDSPFQVCLARRCPEVHVCATSSAGSTPLAVLETGGEIVRGSRSKLVARSPPLVAELVVQLHRLAASDQLIHDLCLWSPHSKLVRLLLLKLLLHLLDSSTVASG